MSLERDVGDAAGEPPATAEEASPPARPRIVLKRRVRRWTSSFWPPLLILCAAFSLLVYRFRIDDWQGLRLTERTRAGSSVVADAPPIVRSTIIVPETILARIKDGPKPAIPAKAPKVAAVPAPAEKKSRLAEDKPVARTPPALRVPETPPEVQAARDTARAEADIRRLALQADAEQARILKEKELAIAIDRAETKQHRAELLVSLRRIIETDRAVFHRELRETLRGSGDRSGLKISKLCAKHGREMTPETRRDLKQALRSRAASLDRRSRVALYRSLGVPETVILDDLAGEQSLRVGSRAGPSDKKEALVIASRLLLEMPPFLGGARSSPPPLPEPEPDFAVTPGVEGARRPQ